MYLGSSIRISIRDLVQEQKVPKVLFMHVKCRFVCNELTIDREVLYLNK